MCWQEVYIFVHNRFSSIPQLLHHAFPRYFYRNLSLFITITHSFKMSRLNQLKAPFRSMIRSIFRSQSTTSPIQTIPPEIVDMIFTLLNIPDQICFSLSCKYVFARFNSLLKLHGTHKSQLLPPEDRPLLCPNASNRPRVQLLLQLENRRWKFCTHCWTLHPHSRWRHARASICVPPLISKRCYLPYAKTADLCPCLQIPISEEKHLKRACKHVDSAARYAGVLDPLPGTDPSYRGLVHKCTFRPETHPSVKVRIRTLLWVDRRTDILRVHQRFKIEFSRPYFVKLPRDGGLSAPCLDRPPGKWLECSFQNTGSDFLLGDKGLGSCVLAGSWYGWDKYSSGEGPGVIKLSMNRTLGNGNW